MTISVLQDRQISTGGAGVSSLSLAFASAVTAGSAIHCPATSQAATNTYSDNNGNTWPAGTTDFVADTVGGVNVFQNVAQNCNAGATTVTISYGNSSAFNCILIREIGSATTTGNPDGHNIVFSTSTASQNITASNTNQPALISVVSINSNTQETPVLDASLTASSVSPGWNYGTANNGGVFGHKRITTTGSQSITNTQASADALVTLIAIFDEASGAPPAAQPYSDEWTEWQDDYGQADQDVILMTADTAPVGPAQPPLPVQDDGPIVEWWQDYEDPLVEDSQWSGPILPNAPPAPVDDAYPWDDHEGDDWDWTVIDSTTVMPPPPVAQPAEDPWLHEDDHTDEWDPSDPVGPNQPDPPVEDAWDWSQPDDYSDEAPDDDGFNVRNANFVPPTLPEDVWDWSEPSDAADEPPDDDGSNVQNPNALVVAPNPAEDGWDWSAPEDYSDDPPDEDGSNVQNANVVLLASNGPEDAWNWDEEALEDNWWDDCLDDGYNVQLDNVIPPTPPPVFTGGSNAGGGGGGGSTKFEFSKRRIQKIEEAVQRQLAPKPRTQPSVVLASTLAHALSSAPAKITTEADDLDALSLLLEDEREMIALITSLLPHA